MVEKVGHGLVNDASTRIDVWICVALLGTCGDQPESPILHHKRLLSLPATSRKLHTILNPGHHRPPFVWYFKFKTKWKASIVGFGTRPQIFYLLTAFVPRTSTMGGLRQKLRNLRSGSSRTDSGTSSETPAAGTVGAQQPSQPNEQTSSPSTLNVTHSSRDTIRLQSEVWNEAYDDLRKDEPGLVDAYERILSGQLANNAPATEVEGCPENIFNSIAGRKEQLKRLIEEGQARTEKSATVKGKINDVIEPFNHLRSVISLAVKNDPVASIAWIGITTVLDVCAHDFSLALRWCRCPETHLTPPRFSFRHFPNPEKIAKASNTFWNALSGIGISLHYYSTRTTSMSPL